WPEARREGGGPVWQPGTEEGVLDQELRPECQGQAGDERPGAPTHPMKPRGFMGTPGTYTWKVDQCDGRERRVLDPNQTKQPAKEPEREPAGGAALLSSAPPHQHERADGEGREGM